MEKTSRIVGVFKNLQGVRAGVAVEGVVIYVKMGGA